VTAPERRRIDALTSSLGAKERALYILRRWCEDEPWDTRLRDLMPEDQRDEYERIARAVEGASNALIQLCGMWIEWLVNADLTMAWLECLAGYLAREKALVRALRGKGVRVIEQGDVRRAKDVLVLPAMPAPGRGFRREMPHIVSVAVGEEEPAPADWPTAVVALAEDVKRAVVLRHRELAALHVALAEVEEALGEQLVHYKVVEAVAACEQKVADLHAASQRLTGRYTLEPPTQADLEKLRSWANVEETVALDLRPEAKRGRRDWTRPAEVTELEELEAEIAGA